MGGDPGESLTTDVTVGRPSMGAGVPVMVTGQHLPVIRVMLRKVRKQELNDVFTRVYNSGCPRRAMIAEYLMIEVTARINLRSCVSFVRSYMYNKQ